MAFPAIPDLSLLKVNFDSEMFLEKRMENDANGNPIYIGWARPGSAASDAAWLIIKLTYDADQAVIQSQVAGDAVKFGYVWNDRANYF